MADDRTIDYSQFYRVGMRIGIDIPLSSGHVFREWGIIIEMRDDFIQIRLSRDILPEEMKIDVGTIFLLVTGKEGTGLCCRGIVVSESDRRLIPLRLISEVLVYERRDYFRIAAYLPMSYEICKGMTGREICDRWKDTRLFRAWHWSELNEAVPMMTPLSPDQIGRFEESRELLKVRFLPMPTNISGGGIRLKLPENPGVGDQIFLHFFIPFAKPNTIDVVGEVVWTSPVLASPGGKPLYYVAMTFHHIDERDRENIIRFISLEQLQQIQQKRMQEGENGFQSSPFAPVDMRKVWRNRIVASVIALVIFIAVAAWLVPILVNYYSRGSERNFIQDTFDRGVQKYRRGSERY